jgi:tryptophan synthase beta chain
LGTKGIIHGSKTLLMQDDNGQIIEPHSISAGLDYPGIGPLHAELIYSDKATLHSITDDEALSAALNCTQKEGIIPALESAHAFAVLDKQTFSKNECVVINLSGRGDKDMETFINHFNL